VFYFEVEKMEDMEKEESEAKGVKSGRDTYSESVVEAKGKGCDDPLFFYKRKMSHHSGTTTCRSVNISTCPITCT